MSGPFHERAICDCGFSTPCDFGYLSHLNYRGRFINVCPECGQPKDKMKVRVLRWHERAWRDCDGNPYNGIEPEPEPKSKNTAKIFAYFLLIFVALHVLAWIASYVP